MKRKVTIQDIADALGISRNTVSKAINNSDGLADSTREKILQKAIEMGYKQFSYVQSLAKVAGSQIRTEDRRPGYAGEIALMSSIFINPSHFASLMLERFQRELAQLGYTLNTHFVSSDDMKNRLLPITFIKDRVRGIICFEMFDWDYDEMLCDLEIPILFVDGPYRKNGRILPADQLLMDNTTGISQLVNDMLKAGRRRIGFIGKWDHCESFFERYIVYRGQMIMGQAPVDETWIIPANDPEEIRDQLTSLEELPDLFLCANDFIAADVMLILEKLGKKVPDDVLLAGFDDSAESRLIRPALTTIHIHTQVMAYSAMQLLISRIENPTLDFRTVYTETDLIYRDSAPLD